MGQPFLAVRLFPSLTMRPSTPPQCAYKKLSSAVVASWTLLRDRAQRRDLLLLLRAVIPNPPQFGGVRNLLFSSASGGRSFSSDIKPTSHTVICVFCIPDAFTGPNAATRLFLAPVFLGAGLSRRIEGVAERGPPPHRLAPFASDESAFAAIAFRRYVAAIFRWALPAPGREPCSGVTYWPASISRSISSDSPAAESNSTKSTLHPSTPQAPSQSAASRHSSYNSRPLHKNRPEPTPYWKYLRLYSRKISGEAIPA